MHGGVHCTCVLCADRAKFKVNIRLGFLRVSFWPKQNVCAAPWRFRHNKGPLHYAFFGGWVNKSCLRVLKRCILLLRGERRCLKSIEK